MENNKPNEILQMKNLLNELNNHIFQINERIAQINNIITQLNNIMIKDIFQSQDNTKNSKIENFMKMFNDFKVNLDDMKFSFNKGKKIIPDKKVEELSEEGLEKEAIYTVMYEGKCSREKAIKALRKYNGNPVEALINIENIENNYEQEYNPMKENYSQEQLNDIQFMVEEGKISREVAIDALKRHNWDLAEALLDVCK